VRGSRNIWNVNLPSDGCFVEFKSIVGKVWQSVEPIEARSQCGGQGFDPPLLHQLNQTLTAGPRPCLFHLSRHVPHSCRDKHRANTRELDADLKPEVLLVEILQEVRKQVSRTIVEPEKEHQFWREESDVNTPFEVFQDEYERFCELLQCL
jgi:hypothetical protein